METSSPVRTVPAIATDGDAYFSSYGSADGGPNTARSDGGPNTARSPRGVPRPPVVHVDEEPLSVPTRIGSMLNGILGGQPEARQEARPSLLRLTSADERFERWRRGAQDASEGIYYATETQPLIIREETTTTTRRASSVTVSNPIIITSPPEPVAERRRSHTFFFGASSNEPRSKKHQSMRSVRPAHIQPSRANSIEIRVEKSMADHRHVVVQPRESDTVARDRDAARYKPSFVAGTALLAILTLSILFFTLVAGQRPIDAFYFSVVTLTTVGYGDVLPRTKLEQAAAIILFLLGAGVVGSYISDAFATLLDESTKKNSFKPYKALRKNLSILLAWMVGGAVGFMFIEHNPSLGESLYWSGATLITVGYGDVAPKTDLGKIFTAFFLLGGTSICLKALGSIASIPLEAHRVELRKRVLQQYGDVLTHDEFLELTRGEIVRTLGIIEVDPDTGERRVTKTAFALEMLVKLGKCEVDDVRASFEQFARLDKAGHGYLTIDDAFSDDKAHQPRHNLAPAHSSDGSLNGNISSSSSKVKQGKQAVRFSLPGPDNPSPKSEYSAAAAPRWVEEEKTARPSVARGLFRKVSSAEDQGSDRTLTQETQRPQQGDNIV